MFQQDKARYNMVNHGFFPGRAGSCDPLGIGLLGIVLCLAGPISAADLTKIDRSPPKLPALHSDHPEYCLLVFDSDAHKRVWLVQDGDVLYVDRNGNGDLTDPEDRVKADSSFGNSKDGIYKFKAGDIPDGALTHKDLRIYTVDLAFEADQDSRVHELLADNPNWRGHQLEIDMEIPGQHGEGVDGRVIQLVSRNDANGPLQFSLRPEQAPIICFGGPWELTFYSKDNWHRGGIGEASLAVGTPALGPGTTAFVEYQE